MKRLKLVLQTLLIGMLVCVAPVEAQYNNTAGNPLRSVLPGVGTSVGIDLTSELLNGTILPIANGGSGGSTGLITVPHGGTGLSTLTTHGVLVGQAAANIHITAAGTSGIPLIGQGAADPVFGTALPAGGGTGLATITAHGVMVGEGTSNVAPTAAGTNGQLLTGSTGADPVFSTLTSTGGTITVTPGAGTLNIDSSNGGLNATYNMTVVNVTGMSVTPVTVLAGVASKTLILDHVLMAYTEAGGAYASGGAISFQYHGGNTITGTVAATQLTGASGTTYSVFYPSSSVIAPTTQGVGIDITNASGAFTQSAATNAPVLTLFYQAK